MISVSLVESGEQFQQFKCPCSVVRSRTKAKQSLINTNWWQISQPVIVSWLINYLCLLWPKNNVAVISKWIINCYVVPKSAKFSGGTWLSLLSFVATLDLRGFLLGKIKETIWDCWCHISCQYQLWKAFRHTKTAKMAPNGNGNRIPATLQAVFLASNRGMEVNKPPAEAEMVYRRNWRFQNQTPSGKTKGLFGESKEKICNLKRNFTSDGTAKSVACAGIRKSITGTSSEVRAD